MKLSDVHLHTKVIRKNMNYQNRTPMKGEIVSDEIQQTKGCGQFHVLVQYERESSARWVAGGNLTKIDW